MKYAVTVNGVTLAEANQIIKAVSEMGFGVPMIAETLEYQMEEEAVSINKNKRVRHGFGVILKNNGMRFVSLSKAAEWIRSSCHVRCSGGSLKKAIEEGKPYMGFDFLFDTPGLPKKVEVEAGAAPVAALAIPNDNLFKKGAVL